MSTLDALKYRLETTLPILNEKQKRIFLAIEANALGRGGLKTIHSLTGVSQKTIIKGKSEIGAAEHGRIRKIGGGRKAITTTYSDIKKKLEELIANDTAGNPEKVLRWTTKSLRKIAKELHTKGISVSHDTVGNLLKEMDYSLQQNQKMLQIGESHPDRNAQFEYINKKSAEFLQAGQPVISVDTKKKELIGNFKNAGAEYKKIKTPTKVLDHDFPLAELGKVAPYGIYDINKNTGFVNLGISHDTAEFAGESILRWWQSIGKNTYPSATQLYINADGGGSNGSRVKLWKKQLQELANITNLEINVSHFPPGTSKWNKIEHRLFCYISKTWQGTPLISVETVIDLISNTTTTSGLTVKCIKDENTYKLGTIVSDEELATINLVRDTFHGEWNYKILPRK